MRIFFQCRQLDFYFNPYVENLMQIDFILGSVIFIELRTNNADPCSGSDFKDKLGRRLDHCTIL